MQAAGKKTFRQQKEDYIQQKVGEDELFAK